MQGQSVGAVMRLSGTPTLQSETWDADVSLKTHNNIAMAKLNLSPGNAMHLEQVWAYVADG